MQPLYRVFLWYENSVFDIHPFLVLYIMLSYSFRHATSMLFPFIVNIYFKIGSERCANAMRHKTHTRRDDGQQALTKHQTGMREKYAKTGERGCGLVHAIVRSMSHVLPPLSVYVLCFSCLIHMNTLTQIRQIIPKIGMKLFRITIHLGLHMEFEILLW